MLSDFEYAVVVGSLPTFTMLFLSLIAMSSTANKSEVFEAFTQTLCAGIIIYI